MMRDRNDQNAICRYAVHHRKWKASHCEAPRFVNVRRPALCRFRVKDDGFATHSSPAMRRRVSDQGMGVTLPSSSSLMRRSITGPQSASYSEGSSGSSSSRLRSSSAASRARACWESSRASLRRSRGSRAMPEVYGSSSSVTTARTLCPAPQTHALARSSSSFRSRSLRVSDAARWNSSRASSSRPSLKRRSPRTLGNRW